MTLPIDERYKFVTGSDPSKGCCCCCNNVRQLSQTQSLLIHWYAANQLPWFSLVNSTHAQQNLHVNCYGCLVLRHPFQCTPFTIENNLSPGVWARDEYRKSLSKSSWHNFVAYVNVLLSVGLFVSLRHLVCWWQASRSEHVCFLSPLVSLQCFSDVICRCGSCFLRCRSWWRRCFAVLLLSPNKVHCSV